MAINLKRLLGQVQAIQDPNAKRIIQDIISELGNNLGEEDFRNSRIYDSTPSVDEGKTGDVRHVEENGTFKVYKKFAAGWKSTDYV